MSDGLRKVEILMQIRGQMGERGTWRCQYCGSPPFVVGDGAFPPAGNKQGEWGRACSGCKGALTRMLRSGKFGPTYAKATKDRLMAMVYDRRSGKWADTAD